MIADLRPLGPIAAGLLLVGCRVYTDKDIQNTGATTSAEALRLLDPSITVSR